MYTTKRRAQRYASWGQVTLAVTLGGTGRSGSRPHEHGSVRASLHASHLLPAVASKNCTQASQSSWRSWAESPVHGGAGGAGGGGSGGGPCGDGGGGAAASQLAHARAAQAPSVQLLPPHAVTPSASQHPPAAFEQQLCAAQFERERVCSECSVEGSRGRGNGETCPWTDAKQMTASGRSHATGPACIGAMGG